MCSKLWGLIVLIHVHKTFVVQITLRKKKLNRVVRKAIENNFNREDGFKFTFSRVRPHKVNNVLLYIAHPKQHQ